MNPSELLQLLGKNFEESMLIFFKLFLAASLVR